MKHDYVSEEFSSNAPIQVLATTTKETSTNVQFNIERNVTTLSDNKPHKVTITVINLPSKYTYSVSPQVTPYAYLKASVTNNSSFPLLPGEINVFMEGNFVAKSEATEIISPNESLGIYLGADPAIKVIYRPAQLTQDTVTLINKTKKQELKHVIIVTNNKPKPVEVMLFGQLPKSNTGQLKVKLIEPEIDVSLNAVEDHDNSDAPLLLTTTSNIRWKYLLEPEQQKQVQFYYTIEYPHDLDFYETDSYID